MSVAIMNKQTQQTVKKYMKEVAKSKKLQASMQGKEAAEQQDKEQPDIRDNRKEERPYPGPYSDEANFSFWKHKAVHLQLPYELWRTPRT